MIILKSRCIFDSVQDDPFEGYITIEGNRITEVRKGMLPLKYEKNAANIFDFGDKTVMSAFCDAHVHLYLGALGMNAVNVLDTKSEEEAALKIYKKNRENNEKFISAYGWATYKWISCKEPSKLSLDKYFPDKPVIVFNDELHSIWVNSKTLEICGIDNTVADPVGGVIKKSRNGEPSGILAEPAAMRMVTDFFFDSIDDEKSVNALTDFIGYAHSNGITSVCDKEVFNSCRYDLYEILEKENILKLRLFFSIGISERTEKIETLKKRFRSDKLSLIGAKGFMDGTPIAHTGFLVEEYADTPGLYGQSLLDYDWLVKKGKELYYIGIPLHIHACGDRAVRLSLNAFSDIKRDADNKLLRNTIEHVECIHPDDLGRLKNSEVITSIQPSHFVMDSIDNHIIFGILGSERAKLAWPGKTLADHGAVIAFGTDYPIVSLNPLNTIYCAVNRVMKDKTPFGGWNPEEKFTVAEALKNATINVAFLINMDSKFGSIECGKLADIVVLSDNIFKVDPMEIEKMHIEKTFFDGELVYESNNVAVD